MAVRSIYSDKDSSLAATKKTPFRQFDLQRRWFCEKSDDGGFGVFVEMRKQGLSASQSHAEFNEYDS